jgi:hypothetical protein
MEHAIPWLDDLESATRQASADGKLVLLDFFNPE